MKVRDLTELAARNLREAILRNTLTTLGIGVGVASLVAMLSLGIGLQRLVGTRLERGGLFDSIVVRPRTALTGAPPRRGLLDNPTAGAPVLPAEPLDEKARQALRNLPHVLEVYPELRFTGDMRLGSMGAVTQVATLPPSASSSDAFEGMHGHFFSSAQAHEAILQLDFARELADTQHQQADDLIGKEIVMRYAGRQPLQSDEAGGGKPQENSPDEAALGFSIVSSQVSLRVAGILTADAMPTGALTAARSGAYLPVAVGEDLGVVQGNDMNEVIRSAAAGGGNRYANLTVRVDGPADVPAVEDAAKQMGFAVFSLLDLTRNLRRVFAILDLLLGIFGSLALAVASLGIVNTLVMSILERRREIGVLKALGASDRDVRRLFFAEAGVMGLLGGITGVALGWAIGQVIQFALTIYLRRQSIPAERIWIVPLWLVAGAIVFSVLISLAAGMYPASRAARLDPVEALRYE